MEKHSVHNRIWGKLPGFLLLTLWPLASHRAVLPTRYAAYAWFSNTREKAEFFLYTRGIALEILAVCMLFVLFMRAVDRKRSGGRFFYSGKLLLPAAGMAGLILLSTLLSQNRASTLYGSYEAYETTGVLLSYVIVFVYFYEMQYGKEELLRMITFGGLLQGLIGVFQMLGMDFWREGPGAYLLLLGTGRRISTLSYSGTGKATVYLSFYNANYAGVYCVLLLPVTVSGIFLMKRWWEKCLALLTSVLLLLSLWGTGSKAGLLTLVLLALLCFLRSGKGLKRWIIPAILGGCFLAALILAPEDTRLGKIRRELLPEKQEYDLLSVDTLENEVIMRFRAGEIHLTGEDGEMLTERERAVLESVQGKLTMDEWNGMEQIRVEIGKISWDFVKTVNGWRLVNEFNKADVVNNAKAAFGEGYERGFTERIYIWSRTIPVLRGCLLFGAGSNTFTQIFPQNDYVAQRNIKGSMTRKIVTKPHSMYLQIIAQTGILSLALLLALCLCFMRRAKKNVWETALYLSAVGFLILGISNDAMVVTLPFSLVILAAGLSSRSPLPCISED